MAKARRPVEAAVRTYMQSALLWEVGEAHRAVEEEDKIGAAAAGTVRESASTPRVRERERERERALQTK
jgi:hypothetical protein